MSPTVAVRVVISLFDSLRFVSVIFCAKNGLLVKYKFYFR